MKRVVGPTQWTQWLVISALDHSPSSYKCFSIVINSLNNTVDITYFSKTLTSRTENDKAHARIYNHIPNLILALLSDKEEQTRSAHDVDPRVEGSFFATPFVTPLEIVLCDWVAEQNIQQPYTKFNSLLVVRERRTNEVGT
jgi:hypothetical protein